ncbi:MAG: hypothetical protein IPK65_06875 [Gammaproteobacteria bacterium]|nr:hypothetical protein [Gammaproteobacteria bacterium]
MAVTSDRQATASLTFNGTGIRFYSHKGPGTGRFEIYIDDVYQTSWDGYATDEEYVALAYENTSLSQGEHTITVRNTSNKNELSAATYMNVDWFEVHQRRVIDSTDDVIVYAGDWTHEIMSGAGQDGTMAVTFDRQATASLTFNGTGIRLYSRKGPGASIYEIYLDGVFQASWDGYVANPENQVVAYQISGLPSGQHTITLRNTRNKNLLSAASYMHVDWFQIE